MVDFKNHVMNNGYFSVGYDRKMFIGNMEEFAKCCKDFVDYAHHNNDYFDCSIYILGKEIPVNRGFKKVLLEILKNSSGRV